VSSSLCRFWETHSSQNAVSTLGVSAKPSVKGAPLGLAIRWSGTRPWGTAFPKMLIEPADLGFRVILALGKNASMPEAGDQTFGARSRLCSSCGSQSPNKCTTLHWLEVTMKAILGALTLLMLSAMPSFSQDCPTSQVLVPKLGGVTCQAMPQCPPGTSMGIGANGFECIAESRRVKVTKNLFAFLPLRAGDALDGICMAWTPAYSPYDAIVKDEFLSTWNHVDDTGWVATWSYEMNDAATIITVRELRHWERDANGQRVWSAPMAVKIDVPLYDKPQSNWPCSKHTWMALLEIPQPQHDPTFAGKGGWAPPNPLATRCGSGSLTYYTMSGHC
jgi:hypothetical protein